MRTLDAQLRELYPFAHNANHYIQVGNGHYMHVVDEGQGEAVLMLHGNPTWSFLYRDLILKLKGRFRCVAPDHIGCGLSDKPQKHAYTLKSHVDHLHQLVNRLELKRVHLVLHDWGGPIGLLWALARPERVGKMVLLNTAAFTSTALPQRIRLCRQPLWGPLLTRGASAFSRGLVRMGTTQPLSPQVARGYQAPYHSWGQRVGIWGFLKDIPLHPKHPTYPLIRQLETGLHIFKEHPLLLCWGLRDFCFTPAFFERFQEIFPHAQLAPYPEAGHLVLEDAGTQALETIEAFLS